MLKHFGQKCNKNKKTDQVSLDLPSSSVERAKRGMVSRLWVLLITRGLVLLSDWEELEEARGRRLQTGKRPVRLENQLPNRTGG